ncbi:ferredoxin [Streptomyces sp. SID3343]|nr:ferredoxin [Streptomyces sp. SID3343]MYW00288.1 ferredoxin [Streptomyces sp. SID3343]
MCIGSGVCVGIAPDRFRLEYGRSRPVPGRGAPQDDAILYAAAMCPALAITVRLAGGGVVIAPDEAIED